MHFQYIVQKYALGMLLSAPTPVLGGFLHTTYRLDTAEGSYAAKVLNPAIMARPEAYQNMIRSEEIARALSAVVPAVCAIETDGSPVVRVDSEYVMLYPWLSSKPLFPPKLTPRHAAVIGDLLAKIHVFALTAEESPSDKPEANDWDALLALAEERDAGAVWLPGLRDALPELAAMEREAMEALTIPARQIVAGHRDLDPKNVLWNGLEPSVIDWEAAGPVDPDAELIDVLLSWADDGRGNLSPEMGESLLAAYRARRGDAGADWEALCAASTKNPLDWLAYNIRRASGVEIADDAERHVGESEVQKTLRSLARRREELAMVRRWLEG
ncbi:MAG: phosphotransferase [Clostridiales bacterium]|nr:phosphotransferase [Clostridiales bacterium]